MTGRIIPARAGFTTVRPATFASTWDHPRSRGVYGSGRSRALTCTRIIPARAGFTDRGVSETPARWDHPRSRGVYLSIICPQGTGSGSSPLARGLRRRRHAGEDHVGIIPARAGFTFSFRRLTLHYTDHPRSRGVYEVGSPHFEGLQGSSPLARGLHADARTRYAAVGIIPARAGFTQSCHGRGTRPGDHPRSRGVYEVMLAMADNDSGSSPLARGLLYARYLGESVAGSSPLARGLHGISLHLRGDQGIIPARAGFTRRRGCA